MSNIIYSPKNWRTKNASVASPWYAKYRFYDSAGNCKAVTIKGVNRLKTASQRKALLQHLVDHEVRMLEAGYNPIIGSVISEVEDYGTFEEAVRKVSQRLEMAETTRRDFDARISQVVTAAKALHLASLPITEIKRRHIKDILHHAGSSAYSYNKQRAYLLMVYKELAELDIVDSNIIKDISKKKTVKKIRETLSMDDRKRVDQHLRENHYTFWRYLHIFFHSGARSTELLQLRRSDVDLKAQRFKVTVKKGKQYRETWRTIKDIALPFWEELLSEPGEIVFSWGLKPGDRQLKFANITQSWWKWVKKPLRITADFYSLKHLHTSEIVDMAGDQAAADHNAHTSTAMVKAIYDVGREKRDHEKVKKAGNKFAC
jgi:integrase